nr:hypothetical protein [Tanacetum cinerariifolium]
MFMPIMNLEINSFKTQLTIQASLGKRPGKAFCYTGFIDQVLLLAWDRVFKIKDALGNKQYKPKDIKELFRKLLDDLQNIHEELAEYVNTPGWNRPSFYDADDDDDVDYTIAITPVLSTEEPDNSLSIPDTMCDVHLVNNPTPLEAKDHFEIVINSNDDYSSSDDDSLYNENIEYVEASPHDSELVSLEVKKIVIPEDEEIEDDNLREKLLKVKEKQEKDKIGSKPDKNGKNVEAGKSLKQLQWVEEEKLSKTQKEWPKTQT